MTYNTKKPKPAPKKVSSSSMKKHVAQAMKGKWGGKC